MFKSINSFSQELTKWYVGVGAFILFLVAGFGVNHILGDVIKGTDPKPFSNNVAYIGLLHSEVSANLIPSRFDISLDFEELTTTKDLLLVFHFIDSSGNTTYWEKINIQVVTNTKESNVLYHRFYSPSDSICKQSKSYKIYLWNKGQNTGVLNQSKIRIR